MRVRACKQRHVVPELDERVAEIGDDALGAAVKCGRHGFVERRYLRDFQFQASQEILWRSDQGSEPHDAEIRLVIVR